MNNKRGNIDALICKALADELSKDEQRVFYSWIEESEENRDTFDAYREIWHTSEEMQLPGKIDFNTALTNVRSLKNGSTTRSVSNRWWLRVAAIFLLAASMTAVIEVILHFNNSISTEQVVYQEIKAAYGTQSKLQLADGTIVYLNSGSKLSFPISFAYADQRKVTLEGEGYFDVTPDAEKPFVVHTAEMDVKVLGTSFNVQAYNNSGKVEVALVEGMVQLHKPGINKNSLLANLKPNDISTYLYKERKLKRLVDKDMYKYMAWKDGKIMFVNAPMKDVIQKLENWYNVSILLKDKELEDFRFTATFKDESLGQVLNLLSLTSPMRYSIQEGIKGKGKDDSYANRKVTLRLRESYN